MLSLLPLTAAVVFLSNAASAAKFSQTFLLRTSHHGSLHSHHVATAVNLKEADDVTSDNLPTAPVPRAPSSNAQPVQLPAAASNAGGSATSPTASPAPVPVNATAPAAVNITVPLAGPGRNQTTVCHVSSNKDVIMRNRDCWLAAKVMALSATSSAQCGTCVLALYDPNKKVVYKPPEPVNVTLLQEQAILLLDRCVTSAPHKTKRATDPSPPAQDETSVEVQMIMGSNRTWKGCPDP